MLRAHIPAVLAATLASVGVVAVAATPATAATSQRQAQAKALRALKVTSGTRAVVVFKQPGRLAVGTRITAAGRSGAPKAAASGRASAAAAKRAPVSRLTEAGVSVAAAPLVAKIGREPAWFFYEDQGPYEAYAHAGRVVLVGAQTGKVTVTKALQWPPLVAGRLPRFLQTYAGYRDSRYRAFTRDWVAASARREDSIATARSARLPVYDRVVARGGTVLGETASARQQAADALAAEHSCAVRVSDTLGNFYDAGPVDASRARLGALLNGLSRLNPGFVSTRYRFATVRSGSSLRAFVSQLIAKRGCADVLLYVAGGGYVDGSAPVINVGTLARSDGRVEQQAVSAATLRGILDEHRGVTFKIALDAPYSGGFLAKLRSAPNLRMFLASAGATQRSFTALPDVVDEQGRAVQNTYNGRQLLEFTNRELTGLACFLNDPAEIASAVRAKADGRSPSFLAWMFARSFSLCSTGNLADRIVGGPDPVVEQVGFDAHNRPPVAPPLAVRTAEDTPVALTLPGSDPDGDPLTFEIVTPPALGTIDGGTGAARTFTPAANATGTTTLTYAVTDDRGLRTTGTVTITIDPVNDVPVVTVGAGSAAFTEGGPAVAVAPALTVTDIDDAQLQGATVEIGGGLAAAEDELLFTGQHGIAGSYDAASGVLALTGAASLADYEAALRSVRYRDTSDDASGDDRTVTFRVTDGTDRSAPTSRAVTVARVNDPPVLGGGGQSVSFTEDDTTGVLVADDVTVSDPDDARMAGATVTIGAGLDASEDVLAFAGQNGISGTYAPSTGTLTLAGSATKAAYQAALRSVRYRDANAADPSTATRTLAIEVTDGQLTSNAVAASVAVVAVNDAPVLTAGGGSPTFTEGDTTGVLVDGGIGVTDVDDANVASATVQIASGLHGGEDELVFVGQNGISGTYNSATGTLALAGSASKANYETALRSIHYRDTNVDDPAAGTRSIAFTVNDGALASNTVTTAVSVVAVNDPPVLAGGGNAVTFTEGDSPGPIVNPSVTVTDVDDANMSSAAVRITAGRSDDDRLVFADQNGIIGTYTPATGTLALSGSATSAQYQTALRSIRYRDVDGDDPSTAARTVTFTVNDGTDDSNAIATDVTVVAVNDAPELVAGGGTPTFTEDDTTGVLVDPGVTVTDVDDVNVASATVQVTAGLDPAEDELVFATQHGITGAYTASTGTLALTGAASKADYETALRSIRYRNTNVDDPSTADRTVSFTVNDGALDSNTVTTAVSVVAVNDAPVLGGGGNSVSFTEDGPSVFVNGGVTVTDVDSADIASATVQITAGLASGEDELLFTDQNGITGAYTASTGTLVLTGPASKADFQTALRSVRYRNTNGGDPQAAPRTVTFQAGDGAAVSTTITSTVDVIGVNDAPVLGGGGDSVSFTEDDATGILVAAGVTVTDVDDADIASATVQITAGLASGEDELLFTDQNGITRAYTASTGTLVLTGPASKADFQTALRSVRYRNTNGGDPSTAARTVSFTVSDGALASNTITTALTVVAVNDAPVLTGAGVTASYTEGDPSLVVNATLGVSDVDNANIASATVAITGGHAADDRLTFTNQGGITGSYDDATGVLALTGSATKATYQAALRTVGYLSADGGDPSTATRTVSFTVSDGALASNTVTTAISFTAVDDTPVLGGGTGSASFTEDDPVGVLVHSGITVADVDSPLLASATVQITDNLVTAEDELRFVDQNGITGAYAASTGTLTLTGSASLADYQAALRSVRYRNTNVAAPSTAPRTVTFTVSDGTLTSAARTSVVSVTAVNDAPTLVAGGGSPTFTEGDAGGVAVDPGIAVGDVDSATMASATVQITGNRVNAEDTLVFTTQSGITGTYTAATGTLALTGTATQAQYQAALRSVGYRNTNTDDPSPLARTVSFTVNDGGLASNTVTTAVIVVPVDDAPTVTTSSGATQWPGSDIAVDGAVQAGDVDSAAITGATVAITGSYQSGEDVLTFTDAGGITGEFTPEDGTLTLSGSATPAAYQAALRAVEYHHAGGTTTPAVRTVSFRVANALTSTVATKQLVLGEPPAVTVTATPLAYTENDAATPVDAGVAVTDPDSANLTSATVQITGGLASGEDVLGFVNAGGITGSWTPATGTLTLTGSATLAQYQTALRSVTYRNTSDDPSTVDRTVTITASDGVFTSAAKTRTIAITAVNDAPTVTVTGGTTLSWTEATAAAVVDGAVGVTDPDSLMLAGAKVQVTTGAQTGDVLAFTPAGSIGGTYDPASHTLALTGPGSALEYQAALRSVTFRNTTQDPTAATRTIAFSANDGTATSSAATDQVAVTPVNDPPVLIAGNTLTYTENDPATATSPALALTDPDSTTLQSATVQITGGFKVGEDRLSFTNAGGITGSYNAGTGTMSLSGTAGVASYLAALRSVKYDNTSENPDTASRTVTYTAKDTGTPALQGSATSTITVVAVNDPPTVTGEATTAVGNTELSYGIALPNVTGNANPRAGREVVGESVLTNDTDVDGPNALAIDVTASNAAQPAHGTVTWNANGTFRYVPAVGYTGPDVVTYTVTDGATPTPGTTTGTVTITVAGRVWYVKNDGTTGDGRSTSPFNTLNAADNAADAANDRIYVFKGDGTSTGLTGGISLMNGQQLIGEAQDLVVGGDTLYDSAPADRPTIDGKVALSSGNTVKGLKIAATGANAIEGATGDVSGTLDDLTVATSGAGAAGISLNGTTGTWDVSNTAITGASGGEGIVANNAGTVNFTSAGTISVNTAGRGVTISGTATSGVIDQTTVTASPTTGVSLTNETGSLSLPTVALTTSGTGLLVSSANNVQVGAGTVSASGAPALDLNADGTATVTTPPSVTLSSADASGGTRGLNVTGFNGTLSVGGGTLSGHSDAEVNIAGGNGAIAYGGTIGNGTGLSARVTNRTGGTITLSGNINDTSDASGGIAMSGNSGGSTTFSGTTKTLNTGSSNAVDLSFTGGHTVSFTGGGLDIDTTTGTGFNATSSNGNVAVTGTGNTINAASGGVALNVNGPDFTGSGATFQSIASNGASSGIVLADTGTSGGLTVTGSSGTVASGGTITGSTGPGVSLTNTKGVALASMDVKNGGDDGVRGAGVNGFALTGGSRVTSNGNAVTERGLDFTELSGAVTITGATVTGSADDNVRIANDAATITNLDVNGGTFGTNSTTTGNDGIQIENDGSGSTTGTIQNATFTMNRGDHIQVTTDASNTATQNVTIKGNTMIGDGNQAGSTTLGGGITVNPAGNANTTVTIDGNSIKRARDTAIVVNSPLGSNATVNATIVNNTIGTSGELDSGSATGDGIYVNGHGLSTINTLIQGNDIRRYKNAFGIDLLQNDGDGTLNATVRGNTIAEPNTDPANGALSGMRIVIGSDVTDNGTSCLDIGGIGALRNTLTGTGVPGQPDIRFRMAGGAAGSPDTAKLVGYAGGPNATASVNAYLQGRNDAGGTPTVNATQVDTNSVYGTAASCPTP